MPDPDYVFGDAAGPEEMTALIDGWIALAKAGRLPSLALRVFNKDGTWTDEVIGGTPDDQAAVLAQLRHELGKGRH